MSHLHTIVLATNAVTGEWYATYQKIPTVVDEGIERSGGKRITERVALDVAASNVFDALDDWSEKALWPALGSKSIEDADARELKLEIDMQGRSTALKQDMKHGEVVETRLLTTKDGAPQATHRNPPAVWRQLSCGRLLGDIAHEPARDRQESDEALFAALGRDGQD
jgi:cytochrome P450/NADPH-cytochrome P450 reductase